MPDNTDMLKFPSHGMHMHGAFSISRDITIRISRSLAIAEFSLCLCGEGCMKLAHMAL